MALPLVHDRITADVIDRQIIASDNAFASGSIQSGALGAASVMSGNIASGQIGPNHLGFTVTAIVDEAFIMAVSAV